MSQMALHALVGTALTDSSFCHDLLNGRRHTLLGEFDLTDEERQAVMVVEAVSIQEFAARLCEWLKVQEGLVSHSPMAASVSYPSLRSRGRSAFRQENITPRQYPY